MRIDLVRRARGGAANMVDQPRFDTVAHTHSWSGGSAPTGIRPSPETSTKHRRTIGTLAGVEAVSSEEAMGAASSLIRWGGIAAVLGGLSTTFVSGLLPPLSSPNDGE